MEKCRIGHFAEAGKVMRAAVLALQGAFAEHERILGDMGVECMEIRQEKDAYRDFDALILPGGESTAMGKLLRDYHLLGILKEKIEKGLPVLGTCAGLILLAKRLADGEIPHLATMPVTVKRNAYGRQIGVAFHPELTGYRCVYEMLFST